jgi:enamine deaminase RidA (YjgF/YER057c/UK114 family)
MHVFEKNIKELDITIPKLSVPIANYVPYKVIDNILYVSGQGPVIDGQVIYKGKVGSDISIEDGIEASKICCLNILASIKHVTDNDWDKFGEMIKLGGFVNSNSDFHDQPKIINGASDLLVSVFGDKGKHTRFAVGSNSLPLNISVEIEAVIKLI